MYNLDVEAMKNYKELLAANDSLSKLIPDVRARSWTYKEDEIFIVEDTGARVSIDGSLDSINMILQKLQKKFKIGKLIERFQTDNKLQSNFAWELSLKIRGTTLEITNAKFFSQKVKAKAHSALRMIEKLYESGYLDEYLNTSFEVHKKDKNWKESGVRADRKEVVGTLMKFKEENKEKHNKEEIIDVKFEYQLKHNQLSKFRNGESSLITNVIILEPVGDSTYPFKDLKQNKCVGFLTDDAMIPKSKEIIMHPRNEQFDRIRHFLKNSKCILFIIHYSFKWRNIWRRWNTVQ